MADVSYRDLCLDANRPELVAAFWAPVLGRELHLKENGEAYLAGSVRSELRERDDEIRWTVLADPEGNEFCAFTPEPHG